MDGFQQILEGRRVHGDHFTSLAELVHRRRQIHVVHVGQMPCDSMLTGSWPPVNDAEQLVGRQRFVEQLEVDLAA